MNHEAIDDFLAHYGVKGMKWGVRRDPAPGVSRKTNKEARKDATEFARAKMFYGEGAGNRRKLINASVDAKRKRDPSYGKAFDHHLAKQNMADHAQKARSERSRTDRRTRTKQRAGYVARRFTGEMGTQAAFAAAAFAGAAFLKSPKGQRMMGNVMTKVRNNQAHRQGAAFLADYFARNA